MQMPPDRFEALIGELLLALGFEEGKLQVTTYGGDGGIDVRGVLNASNITEVNAAVQVKRWKHNVQAPVIQALRGSLVIHEQGIVVTTSKFSKGAVLEAQAPGKARISLVDGEKLLDLLTEHKIGVVSEAYTVYSLDEEWWKGIASSSANNSAPIPANGVKNTSDSYVDVAYPVQVQATAKGKTFCAELLNKLGHISYDNTKYTSPSRAGRTATGWKSCNGWSLWKYEHPVTGDWRSINELR